MARPAFSGGLRAGLLVCCVALACSRGADDITATWQIEPMPPVAGAPTLVRIRLQHGDGVPAGGARLQFEGHMSHPGMTPLTASMIERSSGTYEANVTLSMAGDWSFVISGSLRDGRRITRDLPVRDVRAAHAPPPAR